MMAASPCCWCCCLQTYSLPWWNLWPSQPGPLMLPALLVPSVSFWFYFLCDSAPLCMGAWEQVFAGLRVETSWDGWLRPCLPMWGMWVWSLVRELSSHLLHGQKNQNINNNVTNSRKTLKMVHITKKKKFFLNNWKLSGLACCSRTWVTCMILFFPRMFPARKFLDSHGCQGLSLLDLGPGEDTVWLLAEPSQSLCFTVAFHACKPTCSTSVESLQTDRPSWDHPFDLLNCFHC